MDDNTSGVSRSNWTYHTALCLLNASRLLNLDCIFETSGKRDAVIRTREDKPQNLIYAEWEWDHNDIFGKGKELQKLAVNFKKDKDANAFLFTYVNKEEYTDYLYKVFEQWKSYHPRDQFAPLYFTVVLYSIATSLLQFERLRTVVITPSRIELWEDGVFDVFE